MYIVGKVSLALDKCLSTLVGFLCMNGYNYLSRIFPNISNIYGISREYVWENKIDSLERQRSRLTKIMSSKSLKNQIYCK